MRSFARFVLLFISFVGTMASLLFIGLGLVFAIGGTVSPMVTEKTATLRAFDGASAWGMAASYFATGIAIGFVPACLIVALLIEDHLHSMRRDVAGLARLRAADPKWEPLKS